MTCNDSFWYIVAITWPWQLARAIVCLHAGIRTCSESIIAQAGNSVAQSLASIQGRRRCSSHGAEEAQASQVFVAPCGKLGCACDDSPLGCSAETDETTEDEKECEEKSKKEQKKEKEPEEQKRKKTEDGKDGEAQRGRAEGKKGAGGADK